MNVLIVAIASDQGVGRTPNIVVGPTQEQREVVFVPTPLILKSILYICFF